MLFRFSESPYSFGFPRKSVFKNGLIRVHFKKKVYVVNQTKYSYSKNRNNVVFLNYVKSFQK